MQRTATSRIAAFVGDLAALTGLAFLAFDAPGALAGRDVAVPASDAALVVAGFAARMLAGSRWREGPMIALAVLVLGAGPAVVLLERWWLAAAAGAGLAMLSPHLLPPRRSREWIAAGALLAFSAFAAGLAVGVVVPSAVLAVGVSSRRLSRRLKAEELRNARDHEREVETERLRSSELGVEVARLQGRAPAPRRSLVRVAVSRRLGAIGAIAGAIARDLRLSGAASEQRLREAASRCASHADDIGRLAMGGAAREEETTLGLMWPRLGELIAGRVLPDHHVEWKVPADLPPVAGSASEWLQILNALAENALAAMPHGGVLTVEGSAGDAPGRARIVVQDNGEGIAPDLLPHVLEPFRTTRSDEGAEGLGLALVASMVEALEGSLTLESAPGRGTKVEIDVPFYAAAVPDAEPLRFEGTVLLADDSREMRHALRRLLESVGLDVVEADSGTVALAQYSAAPTRYRALLLDVVMPGTPVEEVVVHARERRADIPVVLVSGYEVGPLLDSVLSLGGVRFLAKPLERGALVATLRDLFTAGSR